MKAPAAMTFPLVCLAVLSVVGGLVGVPEIFMKNGNKLGDFLSPVFADSDKILVTNATSSQTELMLMGVSSVLIIIVCVWAWKKYKNFDGSTKEAGPLQKPFKINFM